MIKREQEFDYQRQKRTPIEFTWSQVLMTWFKQKYPIIRRTIDSAFVVRVFKEEDLMVITTDRNLVKIHLLCGRDSINEIWLIVRQYRRWMGVLGY